MADYSLSRLETPTAIKTTDRLLNEEDALKSELFKIYFSISNDLKQFCKEVNFTYGKLTFKK